MPLYRVCIQCGTASKVCNTASSRVIEAWNSEARIKFTSAIRVSPSLQSRLPTSHCLSSYNSLLKLTKLALKGENPGSKTLLISAVLLCSLLLQLVTAQWRPTHFSFFQYFEKLLSWKTTQMRVKGSFFGRLHFKGFGRNSFFTNELKTHLYAFSTFFFFVQNLNSSPMCLPN